MYAPLSSRGIFRLDNDGLFRCDIAEAIGVGKETVRTHVKRVYSKIGLSCHAELLAFMRDDKALWARSIRRATASAALHKEHLRRLS